ncbi:hypothetical protein OSB04_026241 [Centaurea solstitialis]|uniref:Uncharacterized protein n=1 Tax=Centaurea solstitialis TaxID=347529 RepID=A0AA38W5Q7_9ASTR|nr:hypothetical protein OSB04_026241 [Centaurea solstitialis]
MRIGEIRPRKIDCGMVRDTGYVRHSLNCVSGGFGHPISASKPSPRLPIPFRRTIPTELANAALVVSLKGAKSASKAVKGLSKCKKGGGGGLFGGHE